jgi:hypothetical protein
MRGYVIAAGGILGLSAFFVAAVLLGTSDSHALRLLGIILFTTPIVLPCLALAVYVFGDMSNTGSRDLAAMSDEQLDEELRRSMRGGW